MRATLGPCICLLAIAIAVQPLTGAQAADDEFMHELTTRTIVVGVKEAPPFSMKEADGTWSGISVELWKRVASDLHVQFRFAEEPTVQALLDKTQAGQIDVAVAALTVTADRERNVDFAQPFFSTGLGVAVRTEAAISWTPVVRTLGSVGFLEAVGALVGLAITTGLAVWLLERRSNDDFAGGSKGLASGVWWSAVAMTQRSSSVGGPKTVPGRIIAVFWMVTSIIALAVFTASVTSVLTMKQLQKAVNDAHELSTVRVGTVAGTTAENALARMNVEYVAYAKPLDGLNDLKADKLDAFVYDRPLLAWNVRRHHPFAIKLLDSTFEPQSYAFAVPTGSPLRKSISISILNAIQSDWWTQTRFRYLGAS
jgi:polar amino acid transport system substrate-binding protein